MAVLAALCCFASAENNPEETVPGPVLQLKPEELNLQKGRGAKVTPSVIDAHSTEMLKTTSKAATATEPPSRISRTKRRPAHCGRWTTL